MRKYLLTLVVVVGIIAVGFSLLNTQTVAAKTQQSAAVFNADGTLQLPTGFRKWVFVGAPLTPERPQQWTSELPRIPSRLH